MASRNGADPATAVRLLNDAGYSVARIASDLGVADSTVYRWRAGRYFPSSANFAALAELATAHHAREIHRRSLTGRAKLLDRVIDALTTDAERAEVEVTAERLRADFEARDRRDKATAQGSMTRAVDPFDLVATARPHEEVMFSC